METLHLTVKKKYFKEIFLGTKTEEYREVKKYWIKRLTNQNENGSVNGDSFYKSFDVVHFRNGYRKNADCLTVEFKGFEMKEIEHEHFHDGKVDVFAIQLGRVLNHFVKN
jgi:hypothetical protein